MSWSNHAIAKHCSRIDESSPTYSLSCVEPNCLAHLQHRSEGLRHSQRCALHLDTENTSWIKCTGAVEHVGKQGFAGEKQVNFSIPRPPYRSEAARPKTGSSNPWSTQRARTRYTRSVFTWLTNFWRPAAILIS